MGVGGAIKDTVTGFLGRNHDVYNGMSPEDLKKVASDYRLSIGLIGKLNIGETATTQYSTLNKLDFLTSKEQATNPDLIDVNDKLKQIFTLSDENNPTNAALKNFKNRIDAINQVIGDPTTPPDFSIIAVADKVHIAKSYAINAIKAQQKQEVDQLNKLLEDNTDDFSGKAKSAGFPPEKLKERLKERHTKETKEFEKGVNAELLNIHQTTQNEIQRIFLIQEWFNKNKIMQDQINEARENQKNNALTVASTDPQIKIDAESAKFKGVQIRDLGRILSLSGNNITVSKDGNSFSLEIKDSRYFFLNNTEARIQQDMRTLAQAVRASGHKGIKFNIQVEINPAEGEEKIKDEAHANLMARRAYTEALRSGFKHEDITIQLNNETYKGDKLLDLFKAHPEDLRLAQKDSTEIQEIYKHMQSPNYATERDRQKFDNAFKEKYNNITKKEESVLDVEKPVSPTATTPGTGTS